MPFSTLDLLTLQFITAIMVYNGFLIRRLMIMPTSSYITGIRICTVMVELSAACFVTAWLIVPPDTHATASRIIQRLGTAGIVAMITIFFWSQLEFLKVIAPFVATFSSHTVLVVQCVVLIIGLAVFAGQLSLTVVETHAELFDATLSAWGVAIAIYDQIQQGFLFYFIMYKLKTTPFGLRLTYMVLMALCIINILGNSWLFLTSAGDPAMRVLSNGIMFFYGTCAIECLMVVNRALQLPKNQHLSSS
ncbi:hypothetical protein BC831DRAFT_461878 [Entophlyctis helioformis]|nr:hypothetical protein BC831DRAFT_461878 [Entophlyctis helioformis]